MALFVLLHPFADRLHAQPMHPCFAFLLHADVHVVCEDQKGQITHRRDIVSFAVSDEQAALAFVTDKTTRVSKISAIVTSTTTIVDLRSAMSRRRTGENSVISTCGGIFWMQKPTREGSDTRDLITGGEVASPFYSWFRCSSDRTVMVGARERSGGDLYTGAAQEIRIAVAGEYNPWTFNISPDGQAIAYFTDTQPLCVSFSSGIRQCAAELAATADRPSISNSGEVLATTYTPGGCYYRNMTDFSPAPARRANDECIGIGYWKPGLKTIQILEPLGRAPQWISPATAKLLRVLGTKEY